MVIEGIPDSWAQPMDYFLLNFTLKIFIRDSFEYLSLQDLFDII